MSESQSPSNTTSGLATVHTPTSAATMDLPPARATAPLRAITQTPAAQVAGNARDDLIRPVRIEQHHQPDVRVSRIERVPLSFSSRFDHVLPHYRCYRRVRSAPPTAEKPTSSQKGQFQKTLHAV